MTAQQSSRHLAAVVFTDMVGYSAMVNRDESSALRILDEHFRLVREVLPKFGGREIKTIGDSFMLEFTSGQAATVCAIAIQQRHQQYSATVPEVQRFHIRIGIHLGDVERRGDDVFGNGVNIAARVQPLAPSGGIAITSHVYGQLLEPLNTFFHSLGLQPLKNIATPIEVFVADFDVLANIAVKAPAIAGEQPSAAIDAHARKPTGRISLAIVIVVIALACALAWWRHPWRQVATSTGDKSVAVLPFANMSEDKANAYFADGMQDEILTALSKIKALKVISRTSTEQYRDKVRDLPAIASALGVATVLEGSVQRAGNRVRINVQLIDARSDAHLWAETYDRDVSDLFAVQSDVAKQIAQALSASLLPAEDKALATVPTQNAQAYDLYLQAASLARQAWDRRLTGPTELPQAITLFEQALALDPNFALAAAGLARAHIVTYWFIPDRTATRLAACKAASERALALQPDLGEAHMALGLYYYWGYRNYADALEQFELADRALPNNSYVAGIIAAVARRQGRWEAALQGFMKATTLDPQNASWWYELAETYGYLRRYAEADAAIGRAVTVTPYPASGKVGRAKLKVQWNGELAPLRTALGELPPDSEDFRASTRTFYFLQMLSRDYPAALGALASSPVEWLVDDISSLVLPKPLLAARAYQANGDTAQALRSYTEAQRLLEAALKERPEEPDLHTGLGLTYAGLGRYKEAVAEGQRAVALLPVSKDAISGPGHLEHLAEIYVAVGDHGHALDLLRQLLAMPAGLIMSPALLKLDPVWDPLRQDPGFKALLNGT